MVKELSNIEIDLKNSSDKSSRKPFKSWQNNIINPKPQEVKAMNFEEETMDKWHRVHNYYHLEKIYSELINMYNVFLALTMKCKKGNNGKEKVEE